MIQHAWLRLVHKHEVCREVEEAGVYFCTCGSMEHQHGDSALHYKAANESASRYNRRLFTLSPENAMIYETECEEAVSRVENSWTPTRFVLYLIWTT